MKMLAFSLALTSAAPALSIEVSDLNDIYQNLDVTSFRSSLMPKETAQERKLPDFDYVPKPEFSGSSITMEDEQWVYRFDVIKKNKQGYFVCFTDGSKIGTYSKQKSMLLRKYGSDLVAIDFEIEACN
ncbi:hypothetical protein L4174_020420 [Photobacterium sp. CCB-ST2H9]|uniref:hypothetical protein n=1 Tax=Photobacterium sp. CCB-ST2H9 TaxID=2912855 RepID=UPI0020052059|nr:hypothetical protein [Photobacterium sp. CCB-ST2H9]UTM59080.1 hypothetical protein L4174_020420 [Photobacterium sp. CCB-ST2H9]